ncbi:unnamed protein product [Didymodactylos carnosus]|uniref:Elongation factor Ts, mitochondrial n=1 Tax=Didymodactylos carnosus TaxID=1234261 RepID=A0A8S2GXL2_9BILA|nr:unnamed protein product [Didymodactylos carnosus]CAF3576413.1 unnamed protein product [Didymodactylos carnosus]
MAKAAKKGGELATEGITKAIQEKNDAILFELNSQTDFTAQNEIFLKLAHSISECATKSAAAITDSIDHLKLDGGVTIADACLSATGTIGEKIAIRRVQKLTKQDGDIFGIGDAHCRNEPALLGQKRGKPAAFADKIVQGKLSKLLSENCLVDQPYVKEPALKVSELLKNANTSIRAYVRFEVGEGIEKSKHDFAKEVADQMKASAKILLKVSGEHLKGDGQLILDQDRLKELALQIKDISTRYELGIVVGGGNIWRGAVASNIGMDRAQADYMGMLATIMNALAIQNACEQNGVESIVYSAIEAPKIAEPYIRRNAINNLKKGRVAIFAGGTGYPFFTTDTAAALRAADIGAKYILMGKNGVDGVYSQDPKLDLNAKFYPRISFDQVLSDNLKVMDPTALTLCRENGIKIIIFNIQGATSIVDALQQKKFKSGSKEKFTHLQTEFGKLRTGRASPSLLDDVQVESYGAFVPLKKLCNVQVPEARQLVVIPYDRANVAEVVKALTKANLGTNPVADSDRVRLNFPAPTEDSRKVLAKKARELGELAKIQLRNVRQDIHKKFKADKSLTEDDLREYEENLNKVTKIETTAIDEAVRIKEKEILTL